jgi:hypothetical protein
MLPCPLTRVTARQTRIPTHTLLHPNPPRLPLPTNNFHAHKPYLPPTMSSHSQSTSGPYSVANPQPPPPILIFELNQARRAKVTRELEALRSGTLSVCPKMFGIGIDAKRSVSVSPTFITNRLQRFWSGRPWRGWRHSSRRRLSTTK